MSLIQKNPKYTVCESGYLERLIGRFQLDCYKINRNSKLFIRSDETFSEDNSDDYDLPTNLIFIFRDDRIFVPYDLNFSQYREDIFKIINNVKDSAIIFENKEENPYKNVRFLDNQNYCACFNVKGTRTYFDNNEFFSIIYEIDGESG